MASFLSTAFLQKNIAELMLELSDAGVRGGFRGSQISHTINVNFSHFPNFHKHLHSTLLVVIWYSALTCWRALAIT